MLEEFKWQKKHYANGTFRYILHKLGLSPSPSLLAVGIKMIFKKRR